jgi:hypothetical protein
MAACTAIPEEHLVRYVVFKAGFPRNGTRGWWRIVAVNVPRILDTLWWDALHIIISGTSLSMYLHTSMDKQYRHGCKLCSAVTTRASWRPVCFKWIC